MRVKEEQGALEEDFAEFEFVALQNQDCLDAKFFTFQAYIDSYIYVSTRTFGYSIPELMCVPYADNANHHTLESCFEYFNSRLQKEVITHSPQELLDKYEGPEKEYFVKFKRKVNFFKNFSEDDEELQKLQSEKLYTPTRSVLYKRVLEQR